MRTATALLNASLLLAAAGLLMWTPLQAGAVPAPQDQDAQAQTEDVLYLADGRILRGNIKAEDRGTVTFEYHNRDVNIRVELTFSAQEVVKIERDVPVAVAETGSEKPAPRATTKPEDHNRFERTFGVRKGRVSEADIPSIYIVPMKGQMGTDVSLGVYKDMVDDIRLHEPDLLLIEMECLDEEDRLYSRIKEEDRGLVQMGFLDIYRNLVHVFKDDLRDIPQAMWIHDSMGISSVIALAWPEIYMRPDARMAGAQAAAINFEVVKGDANLYGKFREGYMALLKGFGEYGDSDLEVMDAMVRPEFHLSATWEGRQVDWRLDDEGEYLVDPSEKHVVGFMAKAAEDFMLCDGVADTMDDVALLHGFREYRIADGKGEDIFESHREDWRRTADKCIEWWRDYAQFMGWAGGEDTLKYLGQAKNRLEKILAAVERYDAVEIRMLQEGMRKFDLITTIELLKERIRNMRNADRGGGGGGRGGFGGGG